MKGLGESRDRKLKGCDDEECIRIYISKPVDFVVRADARAGKIADEHIRERR